MRNCRYVLRTKKCHSIQIKLTVLTIVTLVTVVNLVTVVIVVTVVTVNPEAT